MTSCKLIVLLIIGLAFVISSCNSKKNSKLRDYDIEPVYLDIDPGDTSSYKASEIFESIEYIPLETTESSKFSKITKMIVTKLYFVILDESLNEVLIFQKNGKFKCVIKPIVNNNQASHFGDFCIYNEIIKVTDDYRNVIQEFDLSGEYLKEYNVTLSNIEYLISDEVKYNYRHFDDVEDNAVYWSKDGARFYNLIISDYKDAKIIDRFFEYNPNCIGRFDVFKNGPVISASIDGNVFYIEPYSYDIYKFGRGRLIGHYKIRLPNNYLIPSDFITNEEYLQSRISFLNEHNNRHLIWGATALAPLNEDVFGFTLMSQSDIEQNIIYFIKKNRFINMANIISDKICYALPIIEDRFKCTDGINLYASVSPKLIFQAVNQLGLFKYFKDDFIIRDFYLHGNGNSNPIIVKMLPKI